MARFRRAKAGCESASSFWQVFRPCSNASRILVDPTSREVLAAVLAAASAAYSSFGHMCCLLCSRHACMRTHPQAAACLLSIAVTSPHGIVISFIAGSPNLVVWLERSRIEELEEWHRLLAFHSIGFGVTPIQLPLLALPPQLYQLLQQQEPFWPQLVP